MKVSLAWNNVNDLDLHVVCPSGEEISYRNMRFQCQGRLDVDMNVRGTPPWSERPVENVFWPEGRSDQTFSGSIRSVQERQVVCRFYLP